MRVTYIRTTKSGKGGKERIVKDNISEGLVSHINGIWPSVLTKKNQKKNEQTDDTF